MWFLLLQLLIVPAHAEDKCVMQGGTKAFGSLTYCRFGGEPFSAGGGNSGTLIFTPDTNTVLGNTYSCLPDEETVMRGNFKIGCAKEVHDPQWH